MCLFGGCLWIVFVLGCLVLMIVGLVDLAAVCLVVLCVSSFAWLLVLISLIVVCFGFWWLLTL